ncbi:MAG: Translation initiation factor IF-2 [Candidatus Falkowbacteria bacterium GW2011_GWC2_38_22]|uniref:Translation initiation factor IF-2 n=1 Tax=Candidatus Falkowbacteria bacterium GW2011_GWE1_38_31 TaxID=1618638 RepID=A0A0G0K451_9BACT|nr:MAG: Translation initiation factor IF-2 [Candidatus Falkowbacteria bacterium GW2011_GWF2_38_1205]KKQ61030.1 MAG: Translation initiation factor IF-2 [Candidatus Falkowbacteria bacterium GW2011_GWC2_38_22]KKQ63441.1 MAG: Translation initiation factor IF-2 [Candidatus Falkowbacteria bacterium GW2011_GWF1_38_22]KKQ65488.1 MAG: Translation initiation factor IF-2 [Candidatus Falkowbacteria bacterium GW2011_GWE2_38_254]KKQ70205.1 MAG: Translation initiation factor IF-2 [Candidatus Falkowbacteria ba
MNVTELARTLKVTPNELRQMMPDLGFDIGQKAIKINGSVANKIIKAWPSLKRKLEQKKQEEEAKNRLLKQSLPEGEKKTIHVPNFISVREFANLSELPLSIILSELMKNGIFSSLNEKIDFDTAWLVGSELGLEIKRQKEEADTKEEEEGNKLIQALEKEDTKTLIARPPVIVVMGHVDHGKTKLLDAIRQTHVVEGEAGGITQHIGAYQAKRQGQIITFIDTPGHEAFTAMRSRGARIADIAILVVAADDGVKPQTVEAFRIIEAAKIPYVVAINKIDKPDANIDKVKQELSNILKITPEDWGGKTICAPISALKNIGIDDLLDLVLLSAKTEAENIIANPDASAIGTIIESHIDKGAGPVATILVQNGTLRVGDNLILNNYNIGKVKSLSDYRGRKIQSAGPATPTQILGLKNAPQVGDMLEVGTGERSKLKKIKGIANASGTQSANSGDDDEKIKKLNLIIKSDVLGSAEAIEESLIKINTKSVHAKIIYKGLGNISDSDIRRAETCNAQIISFNVKTPPNIQEQAREKNVAIKSYSVIYDIINDVRKEMEAILEPTITRVELGRLKVLAIFRTDKDKQIIGGKVIEGIIENGAKIEIFRNKEYIDSGELTRLQSGKQDVKTCETDEECGMEYKGRPVILVGDILNFSKEEKTINKL